MPKPSHRKCMYCRERAVALTTIPVYTTALEHDGRKYHVSIADLHVLKCERCGAIVLDDSANERLDQALRSEAGILSPAEIRQNRETLGLTRQQLADLLRISMFTLTRWESGRKSSSARWIHSSGSFFSPARLAGSWLSLEELVSRG